MDKPLPAWAIPAAMAVLLLWAAKQLKDAGVLKIYPLEHAVGKKA
jgi:hypothetical protein